MVREQVENKRDPVAKHKPITFTNRYKRYVQSHIHNQQRIRNLANGFPEAIDRKQLLIHQPKKNQHTDRPITDEEGLNRAYDAKELVHVHGDTLYIAGTTFTNPHTGMPSLQDVYDDIYRIPFWGDLRNSARYKTADATMKANPNIKRVVGHSLGGSTALELAKNYDVETTTYGAPVLELPTMPWQKKPIKPPERYRHSGDPISFFDAGAKTEPSWGVKPTLGMQNPHTYTGYEDGI